MIVYSRIAKATIRRATLTINLLWVASAMLMAWSKLNYQNKVILYTIRGYIYEAMGWRQCGACRHHADSINDWRVLAVPHLYAFSLNVHLFGDIFGRVIVRL